jgi:hypothetical protein
MKTTESRHWQRCSKRYLLRDDDIDLPKAYWRNPGEFLAGMLIADAQGAMRPGKILPLDRIDVRRIRWRTALAMDFARQDPLTVLRIGVERFGSEFVETLDWVGCQLEVGNAVA